MRRAKADTPVSANLQGARASSALAIEAKAGKARTIPKIAKWETKTDQTKIFWKSRQARIRTERTV